MKARGWLLLSVVAACGGIGLYAMSPASPSAAATSPAAASVAAATALPRALSPKASAEGYDRLRAHQARIDFQERARRFFAAPASPEARARDAQALEDDIARYAQSGDLSAGETLMLRVGLIQATEPDPERQKERMIDLAARYKLDAERRTAAFVEAQRRDPAFQDYKQREQRVVAEVMAMTAIPGGLDRDEYLRRRLQREREAAYSAAR